MSTTTTDPLIHDLAIVLRGALHPSVQIGPSARLAARRMRDVLGITDDDMTRDVERRLRSALADDAAPLVTTHEGRTIDARTT